MALSTANFSSQCYACQWWLGLCAQNARVGHWPLAHVMQALHFLFVSALYKYSGCHRELDYAGDRFGQLFCNMHNEMHNDTFIDMFIEMFNDLSIV